MAGAWSRWRSRSARRAGAYRGGGMRLLVTDVVMPISWIPALALAACYPTGLPVLSWLRRAESSPGHRASRAVSSPTGKDWGDYPPVLDSAHNSGKRRASCRRRTGQCGGLAHHRRAGDLRLCPAASKRWAARLIHHGAVDHGALIRRGPISRAGPPCRRSTARGLVFTWRAGCTSRMPC